MDVKGANPFLFTEEEYTSPNSANSNPFLTGAEEATESENPFLGEGSNPFAFDPTEYEQPEASVLSTLQETFGATNTFVDTTSQIQANVNIFNTQDFITSNAPPPQKPTELDLKFTNTVSQDPPVNNGAPKRPPPPRPPPSKETQDLLMSVMGEMDATSSHLLDRIPPTRSPSPISMRDLHSPAPTPEPFGDFLDVGDNKVQEGDLLGSLSQESVCDINKNHAEEEVVIPKKPSPPARPPRPQPPQKPPPPQVRAPSPKPEPQAARDEMLDMFGMEAPQIQKSTADIMNLYNKENTQQIDLLSDNIEIQEPETIETPKTAQENFLSPQTDIQMDTSDSQSKESISSNTFNPFAAVDESSPIAENFQSDNFNQQQQQPNIFSTLDDDLVAEQQHQQNEPQLDTPKSSGNIFLDDSDDIFPNAHTQPNDNVFIEPEVQPATNIFSQPAFETSENIFAQASQQTNEDMFGYSNNDTFSKPNENIFSKPDEDIFSKPNTNNIFSQANDDVFGAPVIQAETVLQTTTTNVYSQPVVQDIFSNTAPITPNDVFAKPAQDDAFDAFTAKFESAKDDKADDPFGGGTSTWGSNTTNAFDGETGFGAEEAFDVFLGKQATEKPKFDKDLSLDSDEEKDFTVVIKPKMNDAGFDGALPVLAPPPVPTTTAFSDASRINPFDQSEFIGVTTSVSDIGIPCGETRSDSQESPATPLFDDDVSQPLEPFPRLDFKEDGWEMHLRQPNKKKITGQRFWKKIFVRLVTQQDCILLQLFNQQTDKDPFQELPLQPCYSVSDIGAQQYDNFGKIFTLKLQYIFYKERPGVRPGQAKKAERITNRLSQFAAYAIQGDYQGCKEFGSDLKKLGLPVEHAPQVSQLMKLGSLNFEDLKQFSVSIEEALFKLQAHRDRALHYKMEEVQVTAVDELYVEQDSEGHIDKQIARVRLFFLGFLTGMPDIELGVNDMRRQGKEVVGRHDIIPVVTEEWIRLEEVEFHNCVQQDEYNDTHIIKFKPPDACYIEILRFRVRPPKNRELPLQLKAQIYMAGNKVELRADVLVPGFASRKLGQVPCEDVMIRFPIPECWIYMFRVEKHFRYGSVKSAHRRTGKIKGIERILGTVDTLQESLIEVTSGQAKYEHQHRAIVWRCPRLPKEGQGAYTTHNMVCRLSLTSYDQMPDQLAEYCYVEFTMPATQVSHTTVRSVSLQNSDSDEPPEKYVRYLARHEYRVGIEHTEGEGPNAYAAATQISKPAPIPEEKPKPIPEAESSSDSD